MAGPASVDEYMSGLAPGARKGTLRFDSSLPMPVELVKKIVAIRLGEVGGAA